ncbi:MAG: putative response regulator, CheY [Rariglobus sp.]|jgi:CheY-like chemotaxis protein|nr:putative response regulator, CheY [Rariglobus sp.]
MKHLTEHPEPAILIVEDDINDQEFIRRAFKQSGVANHIAAVNDGEEATTYLRGLGLYADRSLHPLPRLIITDLKMPRMGGIDLLAWLSSRKEFRLIPTIVLTSSSDQADITRAYEQGAKGYLIKPVQFGDLTKLIRVIADYWRASCVPYPTPSMAF